MNPYAKHLEGQDPLKVAAATTLRLELALKALPQEYLDKSPAPGKWSIREILCHLADCEIVFAYRLRQALAEDHHVIQPFDQNTWAKSYGAYDATAALVVFAAVRQWNLSLIGAAAPEAFAKRLTHPERGEMTFGVVVETMAGHDLNHLKQLDAIAATASVSSAT